MSEYPDPGPELDLLVAERVMDWTWYHYDSPATGGIYNQLVPPGGEDRLRRDWMQPGRHPQAVGTAYSRMVPLWSTDDGKAVTLVAPRLRDLGWLVVMKWMPKEFPFTIPGATSEYDAPHDNTYQWHGKVVVELSYMKRYEKSEREKGRLFVRSPVVVADTLAHGLCLAGLQAVEAVEEA